LFDHRSRNQAKCSHGNKIDLQFFKFNLYILKNPVLLHTDRVSRSFSQLPILQVHI
jgi:hypothetical protein